MQVGEVRELWRYPVKSMRGERLERASVIATYGVPGDRGWAIRDEEAGEIRGAKKIGSLLQFEAHYLEEPSGNSAPPVAITFPDGSVRQTGDQGLDAALSEALDRPVTIWPRQPAEAVDHYRRVATVDEQDMRAQLGLLADEPIPDYSAVPIEIMTELAEYTAPLGTYFDAYPLSLLTTSSMHTLGAHAPGSVMDTRRFRQNVIVDSGNLLEGYAEHDWVGRTVRIGTVVARVACPISRCVMVTLPQADVPRDRSLMRTLVKETGQDLGVYLDIVEPGELALGDSVELS